MFKNLDEEYLFKHTRNSLKKRDEESPQMEYLGKDRGQSERYLITIGRLLNGSVGKIEGLYYLYDYDNTDSDVLDFILESKDLGFATTITDERNKRDLLKNYEHNVKSVGTEMFLKWIVWKVLGWKVLSVSKELPDDLILTNTNNRVIYGNGQEVTFKIFGGGVVWSLVIIAPPDEVEFDRKKVWLETKIKDWVINAKIEYGL